MSEAEAVRRPTERQTSFSSDAQNRPVAVTSAGEDPFLNRELSWLEFNRRVLAMATDAQVPLLERVRFLAIFATNLDEFFMVRVSGLKRQVEAGVRQRTPDGRTPAEQLEAIASRLHPMTEAASECLHEQLLPLLARHSVVLRPFDGLNESERDQLDGYFEAEVFPVLTPLAVDPGHPFPYISNLSLSLAVTVEDRTDGDRHFARVKVPQVLPRFAALPGDAGFVPLEDLIIARMGALFPGMDVVEAYAFRVTRNADLDLEEDEAEDLLMAIEQELRKRRFGAVVRVEVDARAPERVVRLLQAELDADELDTYCVRGLLAHDDLHALADIDRPALRWPPWQPTRHPRLERDDDGREPDIFAEVRERDLLVHHPYDSFRHTVERFITSASEDPAVLAIKQTLYRTSGDSPIVHALIRAAERGKQVVALVELKARFDEEANIVWARALEKAGVHVVYGLVGLKTHCKTALVVRRERGGIRRYCHIGTGNYNPKTARLYTDLGLFSCDPALGEDLTQLFNALTGYARQGRYRKLLIAPVSMRARCAELIQLQIDRHTRERPGLIRLKLNSLVDRHLIADLYRASQAGVRVQLVIRGICCLVPGIPGLSDRIQVISVVGRLLEHTRILQFGQDDFWIGSADWMPRNLDRRVEALTPVEAEPLREQLRHIIDLCFEDNTNAWDLDAEGRWTRRTPQDGEDPRPSQERLMRAANRPAHEQTDLAAGRAVGAASEVGEHPASVSSESDSNWWRRRRLR